MTPTEVVTVIAELVDRLLEFDADPDQVTEAEFSKGFQDDERIEEAVRRFATVSSTLNTEVYLMYLAAKRSRLVVRQQREQELWGDGGAVQFADEEEEEQEVYVLPWRHPHMIDRLSTYQEFLAKIVVRFQTFESDPRTFAVDRDLHAALYSKLLKVM